MLRIRGVRILARRARARHSVVDDGSTAAQRERGIDPRRTRGRHQRREQQHEKNYEKNYEQNYEQNSPRISGSQSDVVIAKDWPEETLSRTVGAGPRVRI